MGEFLLALPMLLFALVAHEFAHGWAAYTQGDDTAFKLGRLTLNPIPHIDPIMTVLMPVGIWVLTNGAFTFGSARPVPITPRLFRNYRRGDIIVSSAGVVTNFFLALLCTGLFVAVGALYHALGGLGGSGVSTAQRMLQWGIRLNLILAIFNLIPIPPLDGSRIFYHLLPPRLGMQYRSLDRFGFLILFAFMWLFKDIMGFVMYPAFWLGNFLMGIAEPFAVGAAAGIFQ